MKHFILGQTIDRTRQQALQGAAERRGETVRSFMEETRREVAILASDMMGAQSHVGQLGGSALSSNLTRADRKLFRDLIEDAPIPYLVLDPRPGLRIVDINEAYAAATMTSRRRIAGQKLFDEFPDNPDTPNADGVSNLFESLQRVVLSGRPHAMSVQRYDVRDTNGRFVERYWRPFNTPVFDGDGRLVYLLHHVVEVTAGDLTASSKHVGLEDVLEPALP